MTPTAKAQLVKTLARDVGFDLVGVTHAAPIERSPYYRAWLAAGHAGTMAFLKRNVQLRAEPAGLLPGARTVICAALNYRRADGYIRPAALALLPPPSPDERPAGRVAQYARGRDYHTVMRGMLERLVEALRARIPEPFLARVFVDTGPLLERELAARAGLGWIGKNTCLLNEALGSYVLLGEVVTTLDLAADTPVAERCGSCERCLHACPTKCLVAPRQLDASRCISYLTIEHRSPIAAELHGAIADRVFGCDVCQQVCPYSARAPQATHADLTADIVSSTVDLVSLINLKSGAYRRLTAGSATTRARRAMWRRNAAIAVGNVGRTSPELQVALEQAMRDPDPDIRATATLARTRLSRR